jgi:6-phosphogluconolactonase
MTRLLIGGYSGDKGDGSGIAVLDDDKITTVIPADSPSWIARHPSLPVLYAVAETDQGRVNAWSLVDGVPDKPLGSGETGGSEPAHLAVDTSGQYLVTANYSGGSISVHRLGPDGSIGERTDLVQLEAHGEDPRQEQAHPHMVRPMGDLVLVTDLGGDATYRYHLSADGKLELEGFAAAPPGSGPRHVLPVGDRYYLTAELSGQVLAYDATGNPLGAVPASTTTGHNQPSELASDGRFLYVANRGPDTISVFALDEVLPRYLTEVAVGEWPRHIALDGDQLYVANERSHTVMVMRIDQETGIPALAETIEVPSPTVILP